MKITKCDKCGKEIYSGPLMDSLAAVKPTYHITVTSGVFTEDIDLCVSCQEKFSKWLNNEEVI